MASRRFFKEGKVMHEVRIMRPHETKVSLVDDPAYWSEYKWDGSYGVMFKDFTEVEMWGRNWKKEWLHPNHPEMASELQQISWDKCVLVGEFVFCDPEGNDYFLSAASSQETWDEVEELTGLHLRAKFIVFDILEIGSSLDILELYDVPLRSRRDILEHEFAKHDFKFVELNSVAKTVEEKRVLQARAVEGLIHKKPDSIITDGKTREWWKEKNSVTEDFWALATTKGNGKFEHEFGTFLVATKTGNPYKYELGDEFTYAGKAGGGFKDYERTELFSRTSDTADELPIADIMMPPKVKFPEKEVLYYHDPLLIEVTFGRRSMYNILVMPRFQKVRDDIML